MDKNKEYIKNTLILFIGKFATQFTSFLLLPLFTHFLLTDDYGWVDLLQSYITLFVPVLTLRLDSAVFRFLIDKRNDSSGIKKVISNVFITLLLVSIFSLIVLSIISLFIKIKYLYITIINIFILMFSNVFLQMLRGLGKNKNYSIASIITATAYLIVNTLLILVFKFGGDSILISSSISNIITILYVIISLKIFNFISFKELDIKLLKKILSYSLPMIPNSLSWWIVNVSDRTLINIFLGSLYNGVYAVSCKFSNLLNSIFSIFNMSWQESASMHINDEDREEFFSNMINKIFLSFSCVSLIIMTILPLIYQIIIGKKYFDSYNYIPILLYANSWNIMISLYGGIYIALKKTKEIASTTLISAVINLIVNLVLVKFIGLYAACISTLISYFLMSLYRHIDLKKYMNLKINFNKIIIFTLMYSVSMGLYLYNDLYLNVLNFTVSIIYSLITSKDIIIYSYKRIRIKKHTK